MKPNADKAVLVYIAGPLTQGPLWLNMRHVALMADELMGHGFAVAIPHASFLIDMIAPRPYEHWLANDLRILESCDLLLRLSGYSPGSEREVAHAESMRIPVVHTVQAALDWRESMGRAAIPLPGCER